MKEMPTSFHPKPVNTASEAEVATSHAHAPLHFAFRHFAVIEADIEGAPVSARGAAHHDKGLLTPNTVLTLLLVLRAEEIPGAPVRVSAEVKARTCPQVKVGKVAESLGDSWRRVKLRDASESLVASQAINKQELIKEPSFTRKIRTEGPEDSIEHAVVAGVLEVDLSALLRVHSSLRVERLRPRKGGSRSRRWGAVSRS